jgi:hypothetical protein
MLSAHSSAQSPLALYEAALSPAAYPPALQPSDSGICLDLLSQLIQDNKAMNVRYQKCLKLSELLRRIAVEEDFDFDSCQDLDVALVPSAFVTQEYDSALQVKASDSFIETQSLDTTASPSLSLSRPDDIELSIDNPRTSEQSYIESESELVEVMDTSVIIEKMEKSYMDRIATLEQYILHVSGKSVNNCRLLSSCAICGKTPA